MHKEENDCRRRDDDGAANQVTSMARVTDIPVFALEKLCCEALPTSNETFEF